MSGKAVDTICGFCNIGGKHQGATSWWTFNFGQMEEAIGEIVEDVTKRV